MLSVYWGDHAVLLHHPLSLTEIPSLSHLSSDTLYQDKDTLCGGTFLPVLGVWTHTLDHTAHIWRPTSPHLGFKTLCPAASRCGYTLYLVHGPSPCCRPPDTTPCSPSPTLTPHQAHSCVNIPLALLGPWALFWALAPAGLTLLPLSAAGVGAHLALSQMIILAEWFVKRREEKEKTIFVFLSSSPSDFYDFLVVSQ